MTTTDTIVIVGGSLAGASAAQVLREEGFTGRITLVGAEPHLPYERPGLSKAYLQGDQGLGQLQIHDGTFYTDHDISVILGARATDLDPDSRQVTLDGGEQIAYDRLLLTTGATPRRLNIPGHDLNGIHYLRTIEDADALRGALGDEGAKVVVVGAGWIGSEVAASARQLGRDVTVIDPLEVPLQRVMGRTVGALFAAHHERHQVSLRMATTPIAFEGTSRVRSIRTDGNQTIDADLVVMGIGAVPDTALAHRAGLATHDGILVNERLQTSRPEIFAAGDVAHAYHPHYGDHLRVEHWDNAIQQGRIAALGMLGKVATHDRLPYFFSTQHDLAIEYTGRASNTDQVVLRGEPESGTFMAFWLDSGRVVAGLNANSWGAADLIQGLIATRAVVDPRELADETIPLDAVTVDRP